MDRSFVVLRIGASVILIGYPLLEVQFFPESLELSNINFVEQKFNGILEKFSQQRNKTPWETHVYQYAPK